MTRANLTLAAVSLAAMAALAPAAQANVLTFDSTADCSTADVTITGGGASEACGTGFAPGGSSALVRSTYPNVLDSY